MPGGFHCWEKAGAGCLSRRSKRISTLLLFFYMFVILRMTHGRNAWWPVSIISRQSDLKLHLLSRFPMSYATKSWRKASMTSGLTCLLVEKVQVSKRLMMSCKWSSIKRLYPWKLRLKNVQENDGKPFYRIFPAILNAAESQVHKPFYLTPAEFLFLVVA